MLLRGQAKGKLWHIEAKLLSVCQGPSKAAQWPGLHAAFCKSASVRQDARRRFARRDSVETTLTGCSTQVAHEWTRCPDWVISVHKGVGRRSMGRTRTIVSSGSLSLLFTNLELSGQCSWTH